MTLNPLSAAVPFVASSRMLASSQPQTTAEPQSEKITEKSAQWSAQSRAQASAQAAVSFVEPPASDLFPQGVAGISVADVRQGTLSDCYFLSALSALAAARPRDIAKMIQDNGNGTYTVRFPGASKSVTVSAPDESELNQYAHRGSNGSTWAAVLEKAFARLKNSERWFPKGNDRDAITGGGLLSSGIYPLTGHSTNLDALNSVTTWKSTTRNRLEEALRNKRVVTASTFKLWDGLDQRAKNNLPLNHVYSVLNYDRASDTLRIRNPWAEGWDAKGLKHRDGNDDGTFTMTLDEFYTYFSFVGYEQAQ